MRVGVQAARLLGVAALIAAGAGCVPCGSWVISNTTADNYEGQTYNGKWVEQCGAVRGSSANWNLFGDGMATIDFRPSAGGDRDWLGIDLEITASFANTLLAEDAVIVDVFGEAAINPGITLHEDAAGLTEGSLEISGVRGLDDVCEGEGPSARVHWELTYGGGAGPTYVSHGTDRFVFSNFLAADCPDPY